MEEKKKKRYFCDFWDKFVSSENYGRNLLIVFCVVYEIFAILEFIIFLALIDDVDIRMVAFTAIITTGMIMVILYLLLKKASKISQKHKEQNRAKTK